MKMICPDCGCKDATYQMFSGGKEGYCPDCDNQFPLSALPEGSPLPRAAMLQTEQGRIQLRAEMDQELARLREEKNDD